MWIVLVVIAATMAQKPREEAKRLSKEATVRYDIGDFSAALAGYTAAYDKQPVPGLLFNIGQCHKQLGNYERAIFFFNAYLRNAKDHREIAETLLAESEAALKAQATPPQQIVVATAYTESVALKKELDKPVHQKWWFWTAIGGGVAVVATVVAVAAVAASPMPAAGTLGMVDARSGR